MNENHVIKVKNKVLTYIKLFRNSYKSFYHKHITLLAFRNKINNGFGVIKGFINKMPRLY